MKNTNIEKLAKNASTNEAQFFKRSIGHYLTTQKKTMMTKDRVTSPRIMNKKVESLENVMSTAGNDEKKINFSKKPQIFKQSKVEVQTFNLELSKQGKIKSEHKQRNYIKINSSKPNFNLLSLESQIESAESAKTIKENVFVQKSPELQRILTSHKNEKIKKKAILQTTQKSPKGLKASAKLFNLQKSAFMEKKKQNAQTNKKEQKSPGKNFKMRTYEKSTPRIGVQNSYSDIEDEATPNEYANKYAEFTQEYQASEFVLRPLTSQLSPLQRSDEFCPSAREEVKTVQTVHQSKLTLASSKYVQPKSPSLGGSKKPLNSFINTAKKSQIIDEANYFSFTGNQYEKNQILNVKSKGHNCLQLKAIKVPEQSQEDEIGSDASAEKIENMMPKSIFQEKLFGVDSKVLHSRQETLQLQDDNKYPTKSEKVQIYSNQKKSPSKRNHVINSERYHFSQTFKDKKLNEFNCLVGNKLSLRLQNIRVLNLAAFINQHNLTHIDLRNNRLQKIPEQICDLILLRELKLDYNFLMQLPFGLYRLHHLQFLSASQNHLKMIPDSKRMLNSKCILEYLILNDNKITQIPKRISKLKKLKSLFLHNNPIFDLPVSFGEFTQEIEEFSLDWFAYLYQQDTSDPHLLSDLTKILKGDDHQIIIKNLMKLCLYMRVLQGKQKNIQLQNPQQDDFQVEMPKMKLETINFLQFLMYFYKINSLDSLIMKAMCPQKQTKLSHLISMYGHSYLMSSTIHQLESYEKLLSEKEQEMNKYLDQSLNNSSEEPSGGVQALHQFLNSVDIDFSTPLIYSLRNNKNQIVKLLLKNDKICLQQFSMKYGSPLHVALQNKDFKNAMKILKMLKQTKSSSFLTRIDEDENTVLHIVMKNFSGDIANSRKIMTTLLQMGASLKEKNKLLLTPLSQALFHGQVEAVRFALSYNLKIRKNNLGYEVFDFNEKGGQYDFTPIHFAVYQNNFQLMCMLLESQESINMELKDKEGRMPLDLCLTISAIYKTLRRALSKQQYKHRSDLSPPRPSMPLKHAHIHIRAPSGERSPVVAIMRPSTFISIHRQEVRHRQTKSSRNVLKKQTPMGFIQQRSETPIQREDCEIILIKFKSINEIVKDMQDSSGVPDTPVLAQHQAPKERYYEEEVRKVEIKTVVPDDLSFRTSSQRSSSGQYSSTNRNKEFEFDSDNNEETVLKDGVMPPGISAQNLTTVGGRNQFFRYNFDSMNNSIQDASNSSSCSSIEIQGLRKKREIPILKIEDVKNGKENELNLADNIVQNILQGSVKKQKKVENIMICDLKKIEDHVCDFEVSENEGSTSIQEFMKHRPTVPKLTLKEDLLNVSTLVQNHEQMRQAHCLSSRFDLKTVGFTPKIMYNKSMRKSGKKVEIMNINSSVNKSRMSYLKQRSTVLSKDDPYADDQSDDYSQRSDKFNSRKKINESARYQGMLNMSGMSSQGFSPLMHNMSIFGEQDHPKVLLSDNSQRVEKDPFKKMQIYIQIQIQSDKPILKNEDRVEIRQMLQQIKSPNLDELCTLINKILVLQKYVEPEFQLFLRNPILYELENIKLEIQNVEAYKGTNQFMKRRPSLAKTVKPGKKNKFYQPDDDIEYIKSVDFYKEYTDYKDRTIEQEDIAKPNRSFLYKKHF